MGFDAILRKYQLEDPALSALPKIVRAAAADPTLRAPGGFISRLLRVPRWSSWV